MPSTFTWLDYSEHERRKMLDVIELFGEKSTRDELGLGGVRDAFADLLFPGTSTIQTAAKYFLFVPWIYLELEHKRTAANRVALRARKLEVELARALEASGETDGVIGRFAKEKLQRLPSSIYWQGLLQWGFRVFPGSQDEYHRSLDLFYERSRSRKFAHLEHEGETADEADLHNWHVGLPPVPVNFPANVTLALNITEAEYLRERILTNRPQSLLAYVVRYQVPVEDIPWAWDLRANLPNKLQDIVEHGWNFSITLHGAQLLYNLMLAELRNWQEAIDHYRMLLDQWWQHITIRRASLQVWDRLQFWDTVFQGNPRVSPRAKGFINTWIDFVLSAADLNSIKNNPAACQLIEHREVQLKGPRMARLRDSRALELWNGSAGAGQMDLRWTAARRIISDILVGLEAATHA